MTIAATVRQARLRPEGAERYPTLPVHMWTSAACVAELVTSWRGARPERPENGAQERPLSAAHFQFRGGFPRRSGGLLARTRLGEPALEPIIGTDQDESFLPVCRERPSNPVGFPH